MKSLIVSLCFLAFTVVLVSVNCLYVTDVLGDISETLNSLSEISQEEDISPQTAAAVRSLKEYWDRHKRLLSLTVNAAEIRDCSVAIGNLVAFSESDTTADYNAALSDVRTRIDTLLRRERFSLGNIF